MKADETFWSWLTSIRLSRLLLVLFPCFIIGPLVTYWILTTSVETQSRRIVEGVDSADTARRVLGLIEFDHLSGPDIKDRIQELLRIKDSVQAELRSLEKKRQVMLTDLSTLTHNIEKMRTTSRKEEKELERIKFSIQQTKLMEAEMLERNTPGMSAPLPMLATASLFRVLNPPLEHETQSCSMETCFDYSRCSISSGMPVFLYRDLSLQPSRIQQSDSTRAWYTLLSESTILASDPDNACVYVALVDNSTSGQEAVISDRYSHWQGDGRNHILLMETDQPTARKQHGRQLQQSRGIVVSQRFGGPNDPSWHQLEFRPGFDLALPHGYFVHADPGRPVWKQHPGHLPLWRRHLVSFVGEKSTGHGGNEHEKAVVDTLNGWARKPVVAGDNLYVQLQCVNEAPATRDKNTGEASPGEWRLCGSESERLSVLKESTFALILVPGGWSAHVSTTSLQQRLHEALVSGTIPVVLGTEMLLPLSETVDWSRFSLVLPRSRITELHFLLRSLPNTDIFNMKRQGRLVFETYFSDRDKVIPSILAAVRSRIHIPPPAIRDTPSKSVFNESFHPLLLDQLPVENEPEENLGPLESPLPSLSFRRNYSSTLIQRDELWNKQMDPFHLFPHTPWEPLLPTEAKFLASGSGFRPVCGGEGGSGKEFSQAIGGNSPQEQFTVVMLTYEREAVLVSSLSRLYGLPYLNKVIVVWNSPKDPDQEMRWPDIGVPIHVVRGKGNSLNNRFLPFSDIETEAILSVDDDSHLRHDEIVFGFRVWRENRDRIVGFPGRFHAWDRNHTAWNYNANYSCELSMVLTGAAFLHKYYTYLYTYSMPQEIRVLVDEWMNCEDLAMNFLVSHVTRQPPVKVTSRWTFRCPGCPVSLSEDDSHFQERHKCINMFTSVYGYNPLLYTQYRADSVLFKTRIPPDKQKCFKFI